MNTMPRLAALAAAALVATACTYRQPAGNLVSQRLTWFSYLGAEDIRAACGPRTPTRYRLVYNADFVKQARGYDVWDTRDGAVIDQVVDRGLTLARDTPVAEIGVPVRARARLDAAEFEQFRALLRASGAFEPPPVGLRLNSRGYYWVVGGCHEGRFFLTGYDYPSARFERIRFAEFLAARDRTGVAYPRLPEPGLARFEARCARVRGGTPDNPICFEVEIGADGLVGLNTFD
ncbi:MAG: hypothetical protein HKM95_07445 [Inquilinus sp.]|nr:hypothetical protein [Inquilinus sp.]